MAALAHDPTSCQQCERLPAGTWGRYWMGAHPGPWHVFADGPDLMARLPSEAHYVTVLACQRGTDGTPVCHRGPLYGELDHDDPAVAFNEIRTCLELLQVEDDIPLEALRIWHSGGRGPHVTIPAVVIGAEDGHPQLPGIYRAMVERLFPASITPPLDRSVYSAGKGRMWRLSNRRRPDNGRYKVPLAVREVLHRSYADLEALTVRPRKGVYWLPESELSPCPSLVRLYREAQAEVERQQAPPSSGGRHIAYPGGNVQRLIDRCAFIRYCRDEAASLPEPWWYAMVSNVARCSDGPAAVHALSAPYPGYSRQETDAKIAHALSASGPHACATIQALGFTGCPPWGCGVKAPAALAGHAPRHAAPGGLRTVQAGEVKTWHS